MRRRLHWSHFSATVFGMSAATLATAIIAGHTHHPHGWRGALGVVIVLAAALFSLYSPPPSAPPGELTEEEWERPSQFSSRTGQL